MTSGSGILHEEMPQVRSKGIGGLQPWLNLPAGEKMSRPKYRDLPGERLTETEMDFHGRIGTDLVGISDRCSHILIRATASRSVSALR